MSAFSGKQYKGAARDRRSTKREEAEARNKLTKPEDRKAYRVRVLEDIHGGTK